MVINRYDGIILPPDKENQSVFNYIGYALRIKNPYDSSMLAKYVDTTIEAMFYELDYSESDTTKFVTFEEVLYYLNDIYSATNRTFKRKYESVQVNI